MIDKIYGIISYLYTIQIMDHLHVTHTVQPYKIYKYIQFITIKHIIKI